jgi:hypothetical protein
MCIDYRSLNNITLKKWYPLQRIDDLLDQLQHAKYFTVINLKLGYHHVRFKEGYSFRTRKGLYEWLVMKFILCNTPTTFMRLMNDVLHPCLDSFVIVYLDVILVYSATWEEHILHIMKVLETLKKHHLLGNIKKYNFSHYSFVYFPFEVETDASGYSMGAVMT